MYFEYNLNIRGDHHSKKVPESRVAIPAFINNETAANEMESMGAL